MKSSALDRVVSRLVTPLHEISSLVGAFRGGGRSRDLLTGSSGADPTTPSTHPTWYPETCRTRVRARSVRNRGTWQCQTCSPASPGGASTTTPGDASVSRRCIVSCGAVPDPRRGSTCVMSVRTPTVSSAFVVTYMCTRNVHLMRPSTISVESPLVEVGRMEAAQRTDRNQLPLPPLPMPPQWDLRLALWPRLLREVELDASSIARANMSVSMDSPKSVISGACLIAKHWCSAGGAVHQAMSAVKVRRASRS